MHIPEYLSVLIALSYTEVVFLAKYYFLKQIISNHLPHMVSRSDVNVCFTYSYSLCIKIIFFRI